MGWWRLTRRRRSKLGDPPDYYREGIKLANAKKYHEALTSFRLALRQTPDDAEIMQQMAVVYTHIGMPDEAIKFYQEAIKRSAESPAAHYGLAFLLLNRGEAEAARRHLHAFLTHPPAGDDASAHIEHARQTLQLIDAGGPPSEGAGETAGA